MCIKEKWCFSYCVLSDCLTGSHCGTEPLLASVLASGETVCVQRVWVWVSCSLRLMMFLTRSLSRNKEQLVATLLVVTHILIHTFEKTALTVSVCVCLSVCMPLTAASMLRTLHWDALQLLAMFSEAALQTGPRPPQITSTSVRAC